MTLTQLRSETAIDTPGVRTIDMTLDMEKYDYDMRDALYVHRVLEGIKGSRSRGELSTPGIVIDGRRHDVSFGLSSLAAAVAAARRA